MSKRSPAWPNSSPSKLSRPLLSSLTGSSDHCNSASSSSSSMSLQESPQKLQKHKICATSTYPVAGLDVETFEEFIKAEEELRDDHLADYQVFLDVPEVHPDYSSNFQMFMDQFSKRFGDDSVRCKELWETFWCEVINDKKEQEWKVKKAVLIKQFQIKSHSDCNNKRLKDDVHTPEKQDKWSENKKIDFVDISGDTEEKGRENVSFSEGLPSQQTHSLAKSSIYKENTTNESTSPIALSRDEGSGAKETKDASLSHSLELLDDVCDLLEDPCGSILRRAIKKMKDLESNKKVLSFLNNKDTIKLLQWTSTKLKILSTEAEGAQKSKLMHCSKIALKFIEYSKAGMWNQKYGGLDVKNVALATYNKDVSSTVAIIKESLKYVGVLNPPPETISNMFAEVSACHLKMAIDN